MPYNKQRDELQILFEKLSQRDQGMQAIGLKFVGDWRRPQIIRTAPTEIACIKGRGGA